MNLDNSMSAGNILPVGIIKVDWSYGLYCEDPVVSPKKAVELIAPYIYDSSKEIALALFSDNVNRPICVGILGVGDENHVTFSAKDVCQMALATNASYVTLIHNHPGNGKKYSNLRPSKDDIAITKKITDALYLFDIHVNDHIIVSGYWKNSKTFDPAIYSIRSHLNYTNLITKPSRIDPDKISELDIKWDPSLGLNDYKASQEVIEKEDVINRDIVTDNSISL